jgi:N-acetylglucosamine-6-phosphate deacetylase
MIYSGVSVFTGKPVEVRVEKGTIQEVREIPAAEGLPYLSPGIFDIQINWYQGVDYSDEQLSPEKVQEICRALAKRGITRHCPTIITNPRERILQNLRTLRTAYNLYPAVRASVVGIHLEGPFLSDEDGPRGAHDKLYVRDPDIGEFEAWQEAAEGLVKIVTLAPERRGALELIEHLNKSKVIAAIGHTGASPEVIREAVQAGARLSTHLGNGSHAQIPRLKNYIWEQLAADELYASIICDGFHLPPAMMKVISRAKGLERLILVSDVAFLSGLTPGYYKWGNLDVELHPDGRITQRNSPFFAGAGHLLDRGIAQFVKYTGNSLSRAIMACTLNPARLIGLPEKLFTLQVGSPAHLLLFTHSSQADSITIQSVQVEGEEY